VKAVNLKPTGLAADAIVGTPHFMSPESISNPETVDARSDLYSLGAVGYWLLAGRTVFHAETVEGVLDQKVKNEPADPLQAVGEGGNTDLIQIIMQCLAKNPQDRPASASQIMDALSKCAAGRSWSVTEAEKWWRKHLGGLESMPAATMPEKTLVISRRG
jgi:serine/threonine-protein kinase